MSEKKIDTKKLMILGLFIALCLMVVPVMATVVIDPQGPDDVSGQKDLNLVNVIYNGATLTNVDWN